MATNEHPIQRDVIVGNANSNKKLNRNGGEGAVLSKQAPTYYEDASLHRAHVGTGSSRKSIEYRREVNRLMLEGDIEGAMKLNISNYGSMPEFNEFYDMDSNNGEFTNKLAKKLHFYIIHALTNPPVLIYPDFCCEFLLETDA